MQRAEINNVRYYSLNCGERLPEWIAPTKRKAVKNDAALKKKIDLIQMFEMPDLSTNVKMSKDGQYILATGVYKPRVRCYDTNNLSIKFDRCMDSEIVKFLILSDTYEKLVFLQEDRYIEIHSKPGRLHRFRIPFFGRDLCFDYSTATLFCVGNRPELIRFNLEQGRFLPPLKSNSSEINVAATNDMFAYCSFGTLEGTVEAWDPRAKMRIATFDCGLANLPLLKGSLPSITSLAYDSKGLGMAVGTQTGHVLVYDIRGARPLMHYDHRRSSPIKSLTFHKDWLMSLDDFSLHIWPRDSSEQPYLSLRSETRLNDLCVVENSGLLFLAGEAEKIQTFYIPSLGLSPPWCHFLDGLIDELEESPEEVVYDQFKFVSESELTSLGGSFLIGTNCLRAHAHGYFINLKLYYELQATCAAHAKSKKEQVKEKIDALRTDIPAPTSKEAPAEMPADPRFKWFPGENVLQFGSSPSSSQKTPVINDERFKKFTESSDQPERVSITRVSNTDPKTKVHKKKYKGKKKKAPKK